mgnify:CR=1 FL=1
MARSEKTLDDILKTVDKLNEALKEERNPQPEGTITPRQMAELKNCTRQAAGDTLVNLYRGGKMDRQKWRNTYVYWENN